MTSLRKVLALAEPLGILPSLAHFRMQINYAKLRVGHHLAITRHKFISIPSATRWREISQMIFGNTYASALLKRAQPKTLFQNEGTRPLMLPYVRGHFGNSEMASDRVLKQGAMPPFISPKSGLLKNASL